MYIEHVYICMLMNNFLILLKVQIGGHSMLGWIRY